MPRVLLNAEKEENEKIEREWEAKRRNTIWRDKEIRVFLEA